MTEIVLPHVGWIASETCCREAASCLLVRQERKFGGLRKIEVTPYVPVLQMAMAAPYLYPISIIYCSNCALAVIVINEAPFWYRCNGIKHRSLLAVSVALQVKCCDLTPKGSTQ